MTAPHVIRGVGVSPGVAWAPSLVIRLDFPDVPDRTVPPPQVEDEIRRLREAVDSVVASLYELGQWVSALTAVQQAVAPELQARVVGLLESLGAAAPGVGYLIGGVLASVWSPRLAYFVAGIGVLAVVLAMRRVAPSAAPSATGP